MPPHYVSNWLTPVTGARQTSFHHHMAMAWPSREILTTHQPARGKQAAPHAWVRSAWELSRMAQQRGHAGDQGGPPCPDLVHMDALSSDGCQRSSVPEDLPPAFQYAPWHRKPPYQQGHGCMGAPWCEGTKNSCW